MSVESNKAFIKDFVEGRGNQAATGAAHFRDDLADGFMFHTPMLNFDPDHGDRVHAEIEAYGRAMPNFTIRVDWMVAEGDMVTAHLIFSGDHEQPFDHPSGSVDPSGQAIAAGGMAAYRLSEEGKLTDCWYYTDLHEVIRAGVGAASS